MYSVVSYGCATAAGDSTEDLWRTLQDGTDHSTPAGFLFKNRGGGTDLELLTGKLSVSFRAMMDLAPAAASQRLLHGNYGLILASTKGRTNDFIWNPTEAQLSEDPLTPLLSAVTATLELRPSRSVVVSNACSSGLAAARLAQLWLDQGLSDVIVLAADAVSDFVRKGFTSLKLISTKPPRPFAQGRDGFLLGEAAAALWLSLETDSDLRLHTVGLDSEGSAVTRPTMSGESVVRAARKLSLNPAPDVILAHGTGTPINDQTEDLAFNQLFSQPPPVTGSKWATGHTLAASGAVDMILACEMLRRKQSFSIHTTDLADHSFRGRYLTRGQQAQVNRRVMISSLGFGGMHAAALVERVATTRPFVAHL